MSYLFFCLQPRTRAGTEQTGNQCLMSKDREAYIWIAFAGH